MERLIFADIKMDLIYRIEDINGHGFYGYPSNQFSLADRLGFDPGHYENQPAPKFDGLGVCTADANMRLGFKSFAQMVSWLSDVTINELCEEGGLVWLIEVSSAIHGNKQSAFKIQDVLSRQLLILDEAQAQVEIHRVGSALIAHNAALKARDVASTHPKSKANTADSATDVKQESFAFYNM